MDKTRAAIPPAIARRAVAWQLALQGGEATAKELQAWLAEDERHRRAWEQIQTVNRRLEILAGPGARAALLDSVSNGRRKALKTLTLLLFAGAGGALAYRQAPWREALADIRTGAGERKTIWLADGTRLDLNSKTAVNTSRQAGQLNLGLLTGEILLTTTGAASALAVTTKNGILRPLGTRFSVRQTGRETQVAVYAGRIALYPGDFSTAPPPSPASVIKTGQRADLLAGRTLNLRAADANNLAWLDGMLVVAAMPLGEFLSRLRPHRPGYLGWDPAVAGLPVSGAYPLQDTDRILAAIAETLPVSLQKITRYWVRVTPDR